VSTAQLHRIRWAVRAVLGLGIAASIAANVLHARPVAVAQLIAAWPPLALLLTVELISRVPVHRRWLAVVRMVATSAIAGIAAWVSYWHMAGVASRYGESSDAAHLVPVSVDGLVVVASVCLVELGGRIAATALLVSNSTQQSAAAEVEVLALPPVEAVPALVTPDPEPDALPTTPAEVSPPDSGGLVDHLESETALRISAKSAPPVPSSGRAKSASARPTSTPRRPFAVTQKAAASMQAGGMDIAEIATALGVSERQARAALRPVRVDK